jgi:hypothetical protein
LTFIPAQSSGFVTIGPGESITAEAAIGPEELPRGRTGTIPIVATYTARQALRLAPDNGNPDETTIEGDSVPLELTGPPMAVDIRSRSAAQLDEDLNSPETRARAIVEIRFREDDGVLPILREHAGDPDLRLHAVRCLGAKGDPQDLALMRRATNDPNGAVRVASTLALGNYNDESARRKLRILTLSGDAELRLPAVQALARQRHAKAIDTFIRVLRHNVRDGEWVAVIRKALLEWTDKDIRSDGSEIAAFERWWIANRAEWVRKNASRK